MRLGKSFCSIVCDFEKCIFTAKIYCQKPIPPVHGHITSSHKYWGTGSRATFTCNLGYKLSGHNNAICMEGGAWSNTGPVCIKGKLRLTSRFVNSVILII